MFSLLFSTKQLVLFAPFLVVFEGKSSGDLFPRLFQLLLFCQFFLFYFLPNQQPLPHFLQIRVFLSASFDFLVFVVVSVTISQQKHFPLIGQLPLSCLFDTQSSRSLVAIAFHLRRCLKWSDRHLPRRTSHIFIFVVFPWMLLFTSNFSSFLDINRSASSIAPL